MTKPDRELGMDREITRRDFMNGVGVAIGGAVLGARAEGAPQTLAVPQSSREYYPPVLTGMRGSHEGSFEVAHDMRDGKSFGAAEETGEMYDLIVVGGGLSGLASAYFFRKALPEARILILDNHDDFGGHAKRNEFRVGDRLLIGYGGTMMIHGARSYTFEAKALLQEIGVDTERFLRTTESDRSLYRRMGLQSAVFFDKETFGVDRLVVGDPGRRRQEGSLTWAEFLPKTPLSEAAKRDILRLNEEHRDYLPGLTKEEKIAKLRKTSYQDYLLKIANAHPDVIPYFLRMGLGGANGAAGIDSYSAWGAFRAGWFPGFDGLGLERPLRSWVAGDDFGENIHFPDGNAGVARLLVRWLIPKALPGDTMEDAVTTPVWYRALDESESPVRIRLNSTVVRAEHVGDPRKAKEVEVTYVRGGRAYRVRGANAVLACYNSIIPYLCPELPQAQKEALHMAVRQPLVYTNVVVRDWKAFHQLGVSSIYSPSGFHESMSLDLGISLGDYRCSRRPEEPMVLHLQRVPIAPGLPARDQFRAGRTELLTTSFETFERNIRDQMGRALVDGGFDPARDIAAITVNRWPHGYAGGANDLYDPDWGYDEVPWVVGRKRFGRITVANSDAAATSLTHAAIDQGHRAVTELLTDVIRPEFQYPWVERT
ncbi:MAG TPA: NAD(P)-binding protein [Vicinamibacteria bacterium]|nr:NAD(P)-binding protein [Vicinamibacteria bacterium]